MTLDLPTLEEIAAAAEILSNRNIRSKLLRNDDVFIKLDGELTGGSYKIRGVENFAHAHKNATGKVSVLSAGNLALAAAICLEQPCIAVVPEGISQIKRERLESAGASIEEKPFAAIWQLVHQYELRQSRQFLHPFNKHLLAGYATLIPELQQDGFTQGALIIPYGLGGLAIALARAIDLYQLNIHLYISEISGFAPLTRALAAKNPVPGEKLQSFIEAMGTPCVIADVFAYLQDRIAGTIDVSEEEVKQEIRLNKDIRMEGAAAASLAAARKVRGEKVALLTGSNISESILNQLSL